MYRPEGGCCSDGKIIKYPFFKKLGGFFLAYAFFFTRKVGRAFNSEFIFKQIDPPFRIAQTDFRQDEAIDIFYHKSAV